jgi:hypothetical protein
MSALWHPALRADWLVLRCTGIAAFARMLGAPALLLACCAGFAVGDFRYGCGWCLAAGALLALGGSHAIVHARFLDALKRWRSGWCGALPADRGAAAWSLLLVTAAALLVSLAFVAALLLGASMSAPHRADRAYALAGIGLALVAGTAVAALRVFRGGTRMHPADGIREPVLALPWLNDPRLPHLLDWQRRAALEKWRHGGSFVIVGIVLAAVPMGAPMLEVAALVLLMLAWSWLAVVMRTSACAINAAMHVLRAQPLDARRARMASLRYPLIAALCALVLMAVGIAVVGQGVLVPAWIVCAALASAWPLLGILRATRPPDPSA